jgi:hypothetical protein
MHLLTVAYGLFNALSLFEYSKGKKTKKKEREYCYRKKTSRHSFLLVCSSCPLCFFDNHEQAMMPQWLLLLLLVVDDRRKRESRKK